MPGFRDEVVVVGAGDKTAHCRLLLTRNKVLEMGSYSTQLIVGLAESLGPAKWRLRTRVGRQRAQTSDENAQNGESWQYLFGDELDALLELKVDRQDGGAGLQVIHPIQKGQIVDWDALEAFWRHILFCVANRNHPPTVHNSSSPVLLIVPPQFSNEDREKISKIFFEDFCCPALAIYDSALCSISAAGVMTGLVVDVGYEKTDITPIIDANIVEVARLWLPEGGRDVTLSLMDALKPAPPRLQGDADQVVPVTEELAEEIKRSEIAELVVDSEWSVSMTDALNTPDHDKEGVEDIASIVASGKMKEYMERKEQEKQARQKIASEGQQSPPEIANHDQEFNITTLADGKKIVLGPERLHVGKSLLEGRNGNIGLVHAIGVVVENVGRLWHNGAERKGDLWQNIVVVGGGARIQGFKEALVGALTAKYSSGFGLQGNGVYVDGIPGSGSATPTGHTGASTPVSHGQSGQHPAGSAFRILRVPDYFSEWKDSSKAVVEEMSFLGGQLIARVAFSDFLTRNFLSRSEYSAYGPSAILTI